MLQAMEGEDMHQDMSLLLPSALRGRLYNMKLKLQDNWLPGQCCRSLPCDVNPTATCTCTCCNTETTKILTEECKEQKDGCCHLQEVANTTGCVVVMVTEEGTDVIIPAGTMNGQQIFVARWEGQYVPLKKEVSRHNPPGKTLLENKTGWTKVKAPKMCKRIGKRLNHKTATQHCQSEKEVPIKDLQDNDSHTDNLVKICMDCCKSNGTKAKRYAKHHSEPEFHNIPKCKNRKRKRWKDMPDNRKKVKDHIDLEKQRVSKLQRKVVEKKTKNPQKSYQVFVYSDIAPPTCLEVTPDMTVKCLQEDIFQTLGVLPEKQRLWTGRQFHLCTQLSLEDHGIGPEANIHLDLTIGLLGGADREEGAGPNLQEQSQVQGHQVDKTGGAQATLGDTTPETHDYQAVLYYESNHKRLSDIRETIRPTLERWDVSVFDLTRDGATESIMQDISNTVKKCMHAVFCLPISTPMEGFKFETFLSHKLDGKEEKEGRRILPIAFRPSDLADSNQTVQSVFRDEEVLKYYESDFWRRLYRGLSKPGSPLSPSNIHKIVRANKTLQAVEPSTLARALYIPEEVVKDVLMPKLFGSQDRQKEEFIRLWAGHCGPEGTRDALLKALQQNENVLQDVTVTSTPSPSETYGTPVTDSPGLLPTQSVVYHTNTTSCISLEIHPKHTKGMHMHPKRAMAFFGARQSYLKRLVSHNRWLDVRGMEFDMIIRVPLEKLYVGLKVDETHPYERAQLNKARAQLIKKHLRSASFLPDDLREKVLGVLNVEDLHLGHLPSGSPFILDELYDSLCPPKFSQDETITILECLDRLCEQIEQNLVSRFQKASSDKAITFGEAYQRFHNMVILGHPGSGKTTMSRWLAIKMAQSLIGDEASLTVGEKDIDPDSDNKSALFNMGSSRLPILVRIWEYTEYRKTCKLEREKSILAYLMKNEADNDQEAEVIKEYLDTGKALIIMDGLDEVPNLDDRDQVVQEVHKFLEDFGVESDRTTSASSSDSDSVDPGNRLILTSRISGNYTSRLDITLPRLTIEKMGTLALRQFFKAWMQGVKEGYSKYSDDTTFNADEMADQLLTALQGKRAALDMAKTPQLAGVIAAVHWQKGDLPSTRVELYEAAIENLTESWKARPAKEGLEEHEVRTLLESAAEIMQSTNGTISTRELEHLTTKVVGDLRGHVPSSPLKKDSKSFLKIVQKDVGILVQFGKNDYRMLHRSFQEYLAGCKFAESVDTLASAILKYIDDPTWREPIRMAIGYLTRKHPSDLRALLEKTIQLRGQYTDLLPSHIFCLIDSLDEIELGTINNKRDIANVLIKQLLAAMYSAAAPKRTPLSDKVWRVILQYVRKLHDHLPVCVRDILKKGLTDPDKVCGISVIVDYLHYYDEEVIKLLIRMLPHDMLSLNLPVTFAVQKGISPDVKMPHLPLDAVADALGNSGTDADDSDEEFIQMLIKMLPPDYVLKLKAHKQRIQRSTSEVKESAESTPYSIVTSVIRLAREVNTERLLAKATEVYEKLDVKLKVVLQVFEEKYRKFLMTLRAKVPREGIWWKKQNRLDEELIGKITRPHWFLIFVALHGGYKNFHTPQSIKQYHEAASYLQLTYNQHLAFSQYVNPKWGEGDLTNQLEAFFASERYVVQDKWQNPPQFDTKISYRDSAFIRGLFRQFQIEQPSEISRQLTQRIIHTPPTQVTEATDIAITLMALGVDVDSLSSESCDIPSVFLRMAQMEESLRDPACRASEHVENDLFQVCHTLQNEDAKVLWSAVIATLTHAGAVPVDTSVVSARYSDNVKKYLIAEFLSCRFTSSCSDDYVKNASAAASIIDDHSGLTPSLLMEIFLSISETHQHGKPIAAVPWPVESIWLRPTQDDIPITVLNNIQTLHPTISFLRTWALSKKNLGSILEKNKDLLPEFLTVVWADQGDKSQDRSLYLRQYFPDISQANKEALLQKALAVASPYYKCRALIRLCSYFDFEKRAEILKIAADVCRQMDKSTQRAELLERLCVEVNDNVLKEETVESISNLSNPEDKARLLARLAFHFVSPRREEIVQLSLDATLMIENEEHKAETLAMLYPQCLHIKAMKERAEEIAFKFKNPSLSSFALGVHGKILHRYFDQLSSLSVTSRDIWTPVVLTALARDAKKRLVTEVKDSKVSSILPFLDEDLLWTLLSQMPCKEEVLNELKERGSLIFGRTAALVLDSLVKECIDDVCVLFPFLSQAVQETFPLLYSWVYSHGVDSRVRHFAALLLAERRGINAGLVPHLVPLLESKEDLLRFRASVVIHHPCLNTENPTRFLSVLGPNVYKQLISVAEDRSCGVGAALRITWMAYDIIFDDPNAIRSWFKEIKENPDNCIVPWRAIERMKAVTDDVWEAMLELLQEGVHPAAHEALLSGLCQQVHKKHFKEDRWNGFARLIPELQKKELTGLRYFKGTLLDLARKVQEVIGRSIDGNTSLNSLSEVLEETIANEHTVTFKDLLSNCDPTVVKGKLRFLVTHQMHANDSWVEEITRHFEDSKITEVFLQRLTVSLNGLLTFDVDDQEPYWRLRSNLLVITVAAARVLPVTFASITHKDTGTPELHTLEENLVEAVQKHRGWNGRRSALQLLGHMGSITPLVVEAIIHGIQDVALVREAALDAIPSLKHLDHEDYLPKIVANLQHQSTLVSYTMAKILTSVAMHAESEAELRRKILNNLAESIRDVRSRRYVHFTYVPCKIPDMPRLDTVFYNTMLKISNITVQRQEANPCPVADFTLQCSEQDKILSANRLVKEAEQFSVTGSKGKAKESYNKALEIFSKYFPSDHSAIMLTKSKIKQLEQT